MNKLGKLSNFGRMVDRRGTGCLKFDRYMESRDSASAAYPENLLPMWIADMDLATPEPILEALRKRLDHPVLGYSGPTFRDKFTIYKYLRNNHGIELSYSQVGDSDKNFNDLVFLPGLVVGLNVITRMASLDNEAIFTNTPVYPPFIQAGRNNKVDVVTSPLKLENNKYVHDWDHMYKTCAEYSSSKKLGWFFLCNPHNPVGRTFDEEELKKILEFCEHFDLKIMSDEIHCDLIMGKNQHFSLLPLCSGDQKEKIVSLHAPSKTFNLAGLCAGYAIIKGGSLRSKFKQTARGIVAEVTPFGFCGMTAAYEFQSETEHVQQLNEFLAGNFSDIRESLPNGVLENDIQGTYLAWLNAKNLLYSKPELTEKYLSQGYTYGDLILKETGIALNAGTLFGYKAKDYSNHVRLNFACTKQTLNEALRRLSNLIK